ncbi:MAG TPA: DUF6603 domain-containing protein [Myxococcaceae bacterium]|nr:DUF6603 domain-containing protein [Myxococcaceae bacterium]
MAVEEIYIARLGAWIARALGEGGELAADLDTEGLGLQLPDAVVNDASVKAAGRALADAGGVLSAAAEDLDAALLSGDQGALVRALLALLEGVYLFVDAVTRMVGRIDAVAATLPSPDREAVQAFGLLMARRTLDALVINALALQRPRLAFLLKLLGLIEWRVVEATGRPLEPRHVRKELHLERLEDLISDPFKHLATVHKWGTTEFDPSELMDGMLAFYREETSLRRGKVGGDAFLELGPFLWSRDSSVNPPGMRLDFNASTTHDFDRRVPISDIWGIDFTSNLTLAGGAIFRLRPPFTFSAAPKDGSIGGAIGFKVNRNASARGFTIIGGNDLIRLTADDVGVGAELTVGASTTGQVTIDPGVFAELKGLTLSLGSEGSDNFLASLLAGADVQGVFDLGLGWKLSEGLVVRAAGGLEIAIPMHQDLGVARLDTLYLILKIRDDGSLALETSVGITGLLGPLSATVERMGVELVLSFSGGADAALGPVDFELGFKPPTGVGLTIDAGMVRGGGYLYLDYDKGEYAGALELVFSGFLSLKAIGLITTRMPDGSDGFSLLVVITAEFGTPFQLGFGFTLNGVGGILGLHRTLRLDELVQGVQTGSIENVMFPRDVVANAPRILSDMRRFFPPEEGTFLIGPMAKLGWGTPSLVTATLGLVIEVPPGNVAILGVLRCVLPDEEAALLVLQVRFIGALEVDKNRLWFFASLFGSRVLFITLDGEMGLLIAWGNDPAFVLSVGGFHPRFSPPPMPFPVPRRIALSILNESYARIRVEGYFAVTSNTAQFGARAELFFGLDAFSVEGDLGFDALFQFSPFYFTISFGCSLAVKVFGAGLFSVRFRGELEGTSPWHVEGEGSISVLFFDLDVPFSHTWGESANTVLEPIDALPLIETELRKRENWVALPPSGSTLSVSLRAIEAAAELVLHPVGALRISQRAVPLELTIQKVGNRSVSDIDSAVLKVTSPGLSRKAPALEPFATSQFVSQDAAARLSAPGYEKQVAGADVSATGGDTRTSHAVKRRVLHELITIDNNYKQHLRRFFNIGKAWFQLLLGSNATARSPLSKANRAAKVPFVDTVVAKEPGFTVALLDDNSALSGMAVFPSQAKAKDALAAHLKSNPGLAGSLHVIPAAEVRKAS